VCVHVGMCACACVCAHSCVCMCVRAHVKELKVPFQLVFFLPKRGPASQAVCPPWRPYGLLGGFPVHA